MTHARRQPGNDIAAAALAGTELRVLNAAVMAFSVALALGYVMLAVSTNSQSVRAGGVRSRIAALREQQQRLEIDVASGRSLDAIEGRVAGLGLVPVERIEYVAAQGGAVAVR